MARYPRYIVITDSQGRSAEVFKSYNGAEYRSIESERYNLRELTDWANRAVEAEAEREAAISKSKAQAARTRKRNQTLQRKATT